MKINIENFAKEQGEKIANVVVLKYDENPDILINHVQERESFLGDVIKGYKEKSQEVKIDQENRRKSFSRSYSFFLKK